MVIILYSLLFIFIFILLLGLGFIGTIIRVDVTLPIRQKTPAIVRTDAVQQNGILTKKEEKKYSTKQMVNTSSLKK